MGKTETLDTYPEDLKEGDRILQWPDSRQRSGRKTGVVKAIRLAPGGLSAYVMIYFVDGRHDRAPADRYCTIHRTIIAGESRETVVSELSLIIGGELERLQAAGVLDFGSRTTVGDDVTAGVKTAAESIAETLHDVLRTRLPERKEVAS